MLVFQAKFAPGVAGFQVCRFRFEVSFTEGREHPNNQLTFSAALSKPAPYTYETDSDFRSRYTWSIARTGHATVGSMISLSMCPAYQFMFFRKIKPIYPSPSLTPVAPRPSSLEDQQGHQHKSEDSDITMSDITPSYLGQGSRNEPYMILDDEDDDHLCKAEFGSNNIETTVIVPKIIGQGSESEPYLLADEDLKGDEEEDEDVDMLESDLE